MRNVFIHPTAIVESQQLGEGTRIWAFTHLMKGASVGANCNIGEHSFIETGAVIGSNVTIKNGNHIWEGITLSDGVFVGPHVFFTNDLYPRSPRLPQASKKYRNRQWLLPTLVKQGASLGAGAVILAGITIGEFSMVAAGAVVTRSVPPYALAIGSPARLRGWVCQCGCPLKFQARVAVCSECSIRFVRDGDFVRLESPADAAGTAEELPLPISLPRGQGGEAGTYGIGISNAVSENVFLKGKVERDVFRRRRL